MIQIKKIAAARALKFPVRGSETLYLSFAPKRCGQHIVFDWLGRNSEKLLHFNNCCLKQQRLRFRVQPITHRVIEWQRGVAHDTGVDHINDYNETLKRNPSPPKVLFSFEDISPFDKRFQKELKLSRTKVIFILRDIYNWLASSLSHAGGGSEKIEERVALHTSLCRYILSTDDSQSIFVNYNQFITSAEYRRLLAKKFDIGKLKENTLGKIPDFGGGSSFDQLNLKISGKSTPPFLDRWKSLVGNSAAIALLKSNELRSLNRKIFNLDHFDAIENGPNDPNP